MDLGIVVSFVLGCIGTLAIGIVTNLATPGVAEFARRRSISISSRFIRMETKEYELLKSLKEDTSRALDLSLRLLQHKFQLWALAATISSISGTAFAFFAITKDHDKPGYWPILILVTLFVEMPIIRMLQLGFRYSRRLARLQNFPEYEAYYKRLVSSKAAVLEPV